MIISLTRRALPPLITLILLVTNLAAQMRIRKQVYDLKISDIEQCPVWEFALDEEGIEGQDEATVRPRPDLKEITEFTGQLVVRAEFISADGTAFIGYITPSDTVDLGYVHPIIIARTKQIAFWNGIIKPEAAELKENYKALKKNAKQMFPLKFRATVPFKGGTNSGTVPGFLYLSDVDKRKSKVLK